MEHITLFDNEEIAQVRKDQEDPWVMYLIVRESLNMSSGKMSAQAAHGACIVYEHFINLLNKENFSNCNLSDYDMQFLSNFRAWAKESFRKVTLACNDEQWEIIKKETECFVVRDAGLTEVESRSETVIALAPCKKSQAPECVKKLSTRFKNDDATKIGNWFERLSEKYANLPFYGNLYKALAYKIRKREWLK